uniref:Uncharacterized protein n=1 Tax=Dulem virus 65 TaxID=3145776 RepID=A0AAU8B8E2_9VIRU
MNILKSFMNMMMLIPSNVKQILMVAFSFFLSSYATAAELNVTGLNDEISGAKGAVLSLFAIGLVVLGIFAGYRYLKRGANSA